MKVRKQISIDEEILNKGLIRAKKMFGGNFSVYLSFLINQDAGDIKIENKNDSNSSNLDEDVKNELDDILGL